MVDFARAFFDPARGLWAWPEDAQDDSALLAAAALSVGNTIVIAEVGCIIGDHARESGHYHRKASALAAFGASDLAVVLMHFASDDELDAACRTGKRAADLSVIASRRDFGTAVRARLSQTIDQPEKAAA